MDTRDELMRVLTEYEGAVYEEDADAIESTRTALLEFLTPIREHVDALAVPESDASAFLRGYRLAKKEAGVPATIVGYIWETVALDLQAGRMINGTISAKPETDHSIDKEWPLYSAPPKVDYEAMFIAEHGHKLAQLLKIYHYFDVADRDDKILALLRS